MQAIQPQMAEIRKTIKDRQEQYRAIQDLQKQYGVRPLAGCLPLLIQLPVLYGLFFALNTVLRSPNLSYINSAIYPFLPKFHSLAELNTYLNWFGFLGLHINLGVPDPTHVLPILAGLATFIQLRMSQIQTANTAGSSDAMATQMKTMQYIMPLVTVFIGWNFAAGLALYWTTSTVFAIVQQYLITGWGSLFELPSFLGGKKVTNSNKSTSNGGSKTYSGDSRKERQLLSKATGNAEQEIETEVVASNGAVTRNAGTNGHASDESTARRRPRSNSASARRRGNAPRRNASRR
jgi:YidC/Oxa1 family membrane protein insertase